MSFLPICLKSIAENPPSVSYEVIVVDNMSSDASRDWMVSGRAANIFPKGVFRAELNNENAGFGKGNNLAIKESKGEYILILNPDAIVKRDSIDRLIRSLISDDQIGAVAPKLFNEDGSPQSSVSLFPLNPLTVIALSFRLPRFMPQSWRNRFYGEYWSHEQEIAVPAFWGAAILVRKAVIDDVGAFDEDFFMYGEDHEWCARINRGGWKTVYVPDAEMIHIGGQSSKQVWENSEKEMRMWTADILAHRKSLSPWLAAATALTQASVFLMGYTSRRLRGIDAGSRLKLTTLHLEAARLALTKNKRDAHGRRSVI